MASTSWQQSQEQAQTSCFRKIKVTILASEWRSNKSGELSTINQELAIQLAKFHDVQITFFLPKCSEADKEEALSFGITIFVADFDELDRLMFPPEHLQIDVIVGHGVKLGRCAEVICSRRGCKWVQVVHTDLEELGMSRSHENPPISKGLEKHNVELKLCEMANFVIGVGPKVTEAFCMYFQRIQKDQDVLDFTPGLIDDFVSVKRVPKERKYCSVLVFGSKDAEDFKLKGFDIAARSVAVLPDAHLVFVGTPEGNYDEITKQLLDFGIPANRLWVRGHIQTREALKQLFYEVDLVIMPSRTESFGLTGLKALSAGLPVIICKNSGFGEALENVTFGSSFVVDSEDPYVWAAAIKGIWNKNGQIRLAEAMALRDSYARKYSWRQQTKILVEKMISLVHDASTFIQIPPQPAKRRMDQKSSEEVTGGINDGATHRNFAEIVEATIKFEAEHVECVRVLPYIESGEVVIRLYVFSGEYDVPESLKLDAQGSFSIMNVKLDWLDLYNNADNVLNVTPLRIPSKSHRLNGSQVDEISEFISKNLHQFDKHRNVTSVQASFKFTNSQQTDTPCITIYVLGKGSIPIGESEFQPFLGPYSVDIVNGFWFRTALPWRPNQAQKQSNVVPLGGSIGVDGQDVSGTLGAIVKDDDTGTLYALSCDHVMKHELPAETVLSSSTVIIHPGLNDHLNYLRYHLRWLVPVFRFLTTYNFERIEHKGRPGPLLTPRARKLVPATLSEYSKLIYRLADSDNQEDKVTEVENLGTREEMLEKFNDLKALKQGCLKCKVFSEETLTDINEHESALTTGFSEQPRVVGIYTKGLQRNAVWIDGKEYFIDAAIAKLTKEEVERLTERGTIKVVDTCDRPNGKCCLAKREGKPTKLSKSGRTTGYTTNGVLVESPLFLKPSGWSVWREKSLWWKNCLCIAKKRGLPFSTLGDSGAVVFEKRGPFLQGFGLIFGEHENAVKSYAIASPLAVVLHALSREISEDEPRALKLVSDLK
ncbi:uncharacterized protein [Montipora foliosa]|uniref:uncharacterized protein n=1 Tax=Montipora foliosa TaxID=591990 RepID=UPI0035F12AD8